MYGESGKIGRAENRGNMEYRWITYPSVYDKKGSTVDLLDKSWVSVAELAEYLRCDKSTVYDRIHDGRFPVLHMDGEEFRPFRISGKWLRENLGDDA